MAVITAAPCGRITGTARYFRRRCIRFPPAARISLMNQSRTALVRTDHRTGEPQASRHIAVIGSGIAGLSARLAAGARTTG